jgi:hypothetical protein
MYDAYPNIKMNIYNIYSVQFINEKPKFYIAKTRQSFKAFFNYLCWDDSWNKTLIITLSESDKKYIKLFETSNDANLYLTSYLRNDKLKIYD